MNGNCLDNKSGNSIGVNGDNFKLAGGRVDLEKLCADGRCVPGDKLGTWATDANGFVMMNKYDDNNNPVNLPELLATKAADWRSPLGGFQGLVGTFIGIGDYDKGSIFDKIAEAYAGPHDMFNSDAWYGPDGNIKPGMTKEQQDAGELMNKLNVLRATPFALSVLLPPEVWNAIVIGLSAVKP